jgi:hypothetical protein
LIVFVGNKKALCHQRVRKRVKEFQTMFASQTDFITVTPSPQTDIYRVGRSWYAQGVTYQQYPATMRMLAIDASHANELYPFSTRAKAEAAFAKVQQRPPTFGQTVKWPVRGHTLGGRGVSRFRFGTLQQTRGNYAIVTTSAHQTERVRLDRLIFVEKQGEVQA